METTVHSKKSVSTSFKRNHTISTRIPDLGVWCKNDPIGHPKWSRTKNPTPPPSVVRNLTLPKNLQLLTAPQPWLEWCMNDIRNMMKTTAQTMHGKWFCHNCQDQNKGMTQKNILL